MCIRDSVVVDALPTVRMEPHGGGHVFCDGDCRHREKCLGFVRAAHVDGPNSALNGHQFVHRTELCAGQPSDHLVTGAYGDEMVARLSCAQLSPVNELVAVQSTVRAIDVGRSDEAQALLPMATISVTEDMATAMRLHANGWKSVYHNAVSYTHLRAHETVLDLV